jgi:hypothetical protein
MSVIISKNPGVILIVGTKAQKVNNVQACSLLKILPYDQAFNLTKEFDEYI